MIRPMQRRRRGCRGSMRGPASTSRGRRRFSRSPPRWRRAGSSLPNNGRRRSAPSASAMRIRASPTTRPSYYAAALRALETLTLRTAALTESGDRAAAGALAARLRGDAARRSGQAGGRRDGVSGAVVLLVHIAPASPNIFLVIAGLELAIHAAAGRGAQSRAAGLGPDPATLDARIKSGHDKLE